MTLLALMAPMGACVTRGGAEVTPTPPPGYNFAYLAPQGEAIGLIQAFDDGEHTYLEFHNRSPQLTIRLDATRLPLRYAASERYITVDGVYSHLLVSNEQASSILQNEAARTASAPAAAVRDTEPTLEEVDPGRPATTIAAIGIPKSEQTMNAKLRVDALNREIGDLDERIRLLTEELAVAERATGTAGLAIRLGLPVPRVVLRFADNSDQVRIDMPLLQRLGAASRAANRLYLHGHTDAFVASDAGTALAIKRAVSVRRLLVTEGVSPARIRLFYRGAGNFVANNSTPDGKAQNRRVEIELRKW